MVMHAAVLGSPIAHSLSPALHRAAYSALGLDWTYEPIEMTPGEMPGFLASLDDSWAGLSLTMPLKESVQPLLSHIDDVADLTGSVNTVYRGETGWCGANTDVFGMVRSLQVAGLGPITTARVLGAGATGRSAVAALAELGASEILVCARRSEKADELAQLARTLGMQARVRDLTPEAITEDLLVSVLPGDIASPWAGLAVYPQSGLLDASYHPWPSPLATHWPGEIVASGRDMLLWQATRQVTLMTGMPAPVEAMRAALPPA